MHGRAGLSASAAPASVQHWKGTRTVRSRRTPHKGDDAEDQQTGIRDEEPSKPRSCPTACPKPENVGRAGDKKDAGRDEHDRRNVTSCLAAHGDRVPTTDPRLTCHRSQTPSRSRHQKPSALAAGSADHLRTDLVCAALDMAARNYELADGAIFHSDRGTQYRSDQFAKHAETLGLRRSVGRTGICYDNALAESFNASLKVERVNRTQYPTLEHAPRDIVRYIEFRYNRRRLHSALGYRTSQEAYDDYINSHTTQSAA